MASLATVVPVAVACSVVFVVLAVFGMVVWMRLRKERLSLAVANASQRRYAVGSQHFPHTTELSHEEGTALRRYGQLPYGGPTEWGLLASNDNLTAPAAPPEPKSQLTEKARSLRKSLSFTHPKSRRRSRLQKRSLFGSSGSLADPANQLAPPNAPYSKDGTPVSAVEGALELPTETTPRQTPERDEDRGNLDLTMRPISSVYPAVPQRQHTTLFPVSEDRAETPPSARVRGGSITTQSAGTVPSQPVPPPPVACPPNRFTLSKDDSAMRLSSLSLDTTESSILDDSKGASATEGDLTSPALPPCPTFTPYSADDVGIDYYGSNPAAPSSSLLRSTAFPTNSTLSANFRLEPPRRSPRRSQTARSPSSNSEHSSPPPRRSESLYTNPVGRGLPRTSHIHPIRRSSPLLPLFSQLRHDLPDANIPFRGGPSSISSHDIPSRKASPIQETPQPTPERYPRAPLPSAMKGGSGTVKGHRRQNCVRISIHPPATFEGSVFPPTFEEAEELEDPEKNESQVFDLSTPKDTSPNTETPPVSMNKPSPVRVAASRDPHYSPATPTKKRKHDRTDEDVFSSEKSKPLPGIFTSLPSGSSCLSSTPSPDKSFYKWPQVLSSSPATHENQVIASPRRSNVKGPRSQPGKKPNSIRSPAPLGENLESTPAGSPSRLPRTSDLRTSKDESSAPGQLSSPPQDRNRPENRRQSTTTSPGSKKASSTRVGNCATIWEDKKHERTSSKKSPPVHGAVMEMASLSPRRAESRKSPARAKKSPQKSSHRAARPDFVTPTRSRVGLGIETTTPGSLYDHDGFLKEYPGRYA